MKHCVGLLILTVFIGHNASSQKASVNQMTEWFGTSSAVKFTPRVGLYVDGQYRFVSRWEPMVFQARLAFDYYLNKSITITPIGATFNWNFIYGKQPASVINNEYRIYQQLGFKHAYKKLSFVHRLRSEERFIQYHSGPLSSLINEGYDENFQFRVRHRVWVSYPLISDKIVTGTFYIASFAEGFMSWGKRLKYKNVVDQYRLFAGVGYQFSGSGNVQVGPIYQYLLKSSGDKRENNIGFYLQLNYNFDLSKSP